MNPLQARLRSLRLRYWAYSMLAGMLAIAALGVGSAAVVGLLDWQFQLPSLLRAFALVGTLGGCGYLVWRFMVQPLGARSDDLSLALKVEAIYPELNDILASTVQFLEQEDRLPPGDSALLRKKSIEKALDASADLDFYRVLDKRPLGYAALGLLAAGVAFFFMRHRLDEHTPRALARYLHPFGRHTWTDIEPDVSLRDRIAVGQPFVFKAKVLGVLPPQAKIEVEGYDLERWVRRPDLVIPLKADRMLTRGLDVTSQKGKFRLRVSANDTTFPRLAGTWHQIEVMPPPSFAPLDGQPSPQIELEIPEYTDLKSPVKLAAGVRHIECLQGTVVTFRAAVDRPLAKAGIVLRPADGGVPLGFLMGQIGHSQPLNALLAIQAAEAAVGTVPVEVTRDGKHLKARFQPRFAGSYALYLEDIDGLPRVYEADLRVMADPLPTVMIRKPSRAISVLPDAEVPFHVFAEDAVFALKSIALEVRQNQGEGETKFVEEVPFLDARWHGAAIRALTNTMIPFEAPFKTLLTRAEAKRGWALKNRYKDGDVLNVQAVAYDFYDLDRSRGPGRSSEIEIRIVGREQLAKQLDEGLQEVQQDVVQLKKKQEEARNLLDQAKDEKEKGNEAKAMDKLFDADQAQKQVQERVGATQDDALREKLKRMLETVKTNKLPSNETIDQIKEVAQEVERLAQEELPQIANQMADARKELNKQAASKDNPKENPGKENPGKEKKKQSAFEKAKEMQADAQKTLDELNKKLAGWADLSQVAGQARNLQQREKELADKNENQQKEIDRKEKDLADSQEKRQKIEKELEGNKLDPMAAAEKKAEVQKMKEQEANLQKQIAKMKDQDRKDFAEEFQREHERLADEAQQLLDKINDVKQAREKKGDKDAVDKLNKAADAGKNLPRDMRKAGDDLKNNAPRQSLGQQEKNIETAKKMVGALEGQKDDDIERLKKRREKADNAKEEIEKLRKKAEKVANDPKLNPEEKAKELRKLAEQVKEEANKLARLQENRAAREMREAARDLEKAADQADMGEDPGEAEKNALDRIEQAQNDLDDFRQELAREQLVKIADKLKGLKERQDTALERTKELHKKVVERKKWSPALLKTLESDATTQDGLAEEARSLQEKLKDALVFEHILGKSAKAMDQASKTMSARKEKGADRRFDDPFDDRKEMDADEVMDEDRRHGDTVRFQTQAVDRLQRLLDAVAEAKPEAVAKADPKKEPKENPMKEDPKEKAEPKANRPPGDGIPPMAQLKALKGEQVEVQEQTKEFARRHPDPARYNEQQRREVQEIHEEQVRLRQLFERMTADVKREEP